MSSKDRLPEELVALERALASLEPAPSRIDRDRLMFDAGAASCVTCGSQITGTDRTESAARPEMLQANRPYQDHAKPRKHARLHAWPLATAASILIACLFATLYAIESSRAPLRIREVVYVDRPAPMPGPVVATENQSREPNPMNEGPDRAVQYSVRERPIFPFGILKSRPTGYIALRQLAIEQGIDALPQPEYTGSATPRSRPRTASELLKEYLPTRADLSQANKATFAPKSIHFNLRDTI